MAKFVTHALLTWIMLCASSAAFPLERTGEVALTAEVEIADFENHDPTPQWHPDFEAITTNSFTSNPTPLFITVTEGDQFDLKCFAGNENPCTSYRGIIANCSFAWFRARSKKNFVPLRPWTMSKLLKFPRNVNQHSYFRHINNVQPRVQGPKLVFAKALKENAGLYTCNVKIEDARKWNTNEDVTTFKQMFVVRVKSSPNIGVPAMPNKVDLQSGLRFGNLIKMRKDLQQEETDRTGDTKIGKDDKQETEIPMAAEFGLARYVMGFGIGIPMIANLAFVGICLTLCLPCLCCSGLSSLCCC